MIAIRTWLSGVFGAAVLLLGLVAANAPAGAAGGPTGAAAAVAAHEFPGRSTIPHLSARLAALAAAPSASRAAQSRVTGTPVSGAGSLQREPGTGRLLVDIRVAHWDAGALARVRATGAAITNRTPVLRTITAAIEPSALKAIARVSGVQFVGEILTPMANAVCDGTISEGDQIMHAAQERTNAGVDGTGVTVGILSDSFATRSAPVTTAAQDVASDNLPGATNTCGHTTPVGVLHDFAGGGQFDPIPEDEGRAMAQIVHDLAPGAKILFATAEGGPDVFADNIRALASAGADIIVDDFTYFNEPAYQDGVIAKAVNDVRAAGVDYFSSAANNNITIGGHDVTSYEAVDGYRPTPCPAAISVAYTDCHNFNAAGTDPTYGLSTATNHTLFLTLDWAEPQFGVQTDYALCFLNSNNTLAFCQDERNPGAAGSQQAVEVAGINTNSATSLQVVVARFGGNNPNTNGTPRFKLTMLTNSSGAVTNTEYTTPTGTDVLGPAIFGHNGTSGAMSIAAQDVRHAGTVESYSSHGPLTLLFGPVDGTNPAAPLATPKVLAKPDITGSDCGINTYFGSFDGTHHRFCGTSAAAPHTAAVAALLLQQIRTSRRRS